MGNCVQSMSMVDGENKEVAVPSSLVDALFSKSITAKLWHIASKTWGTATPPTLYPEYTRHDGKYVYRDLSFWTSGFFPGCLYLLLERQIRSSHSLQNCEPHPLQLRHMCEWWTANLHANASLKGTHDLGFMIAPWATKAWELHRDTQARNTLIEAAHTLASRFDVTVQALRSWDTCVTKRYRYTDPGTEFLVIIDNMYNIDLLFYAAHLTGDHDLASIAVAHARTTQKHHIRPDKTTFHVVNFDAATGLAKEKFTNQGYSDDSCWSRGQAWGIFGFAQTFQWTKDVSFLETSRQLADYFLANLPTDGVPYFNFTAPLNEESPRDSSAAMIAACGLLIIYKGLQLTDPEQANYYIEAALKLAEDTTRKFLAPPKAHFSIVPSPEESAIPFYLEYEEGSPNETLEKAPGLLSVELEQNEGMHRVLETILDGATITNFEFAPRRWSNHGLVYADYFFLLFGNMLIDLQIVDETNYA